MFRLGKRAFGGLAAVGIGVAASLAVAAPASAATYYEVRNHHSGKCLAIGGGSTANGADAIQWPCDAGPEQLWYWSGSQLDGHLKNRKSGKCLSVADGSTANGAQLHQWSCNDNSEQHWSTGGWHLFNDKSGKVVAVGGSSTANGAKVIQWPLRLDGDEQQWTLTAKAIDT